MTPSFRVPEQRTKVSESHGTVPQPINGDGVLDGRRKITLAGFHLANVRMPRPRSRAPQGSRCCRDANRRVMRVLSRSQRTDARSGRAVNLDRRSDPAAVGTAGVGTFGTDMWEGC